MLLNQKPASAVNKLLSQYLKETAAACKRISKHHDRKAVHDFRMAAHRLRITYGAYMEHPKNKVEAKLTHLLMRLADKTSHARDCEAHLYWLEARQDNLKSDDQAGYEWLHARIAQDLQTEYRHLANGLPTQFDEVKELIDAHEEKLIVSDENAFCMLVAKKIGEQLIRMQAGLKTYQDTKDSNELHQIKLAGKELCYLIEPFEKDIKGGTTVISQLNVLLDVLDSLHDVQLFDEMLIGAGKELGALYYTRLLRDCLDSGAGKNNITKDKYVAGLVVVGQGLYEERLSLIDKFASLNDTGKLSKLFESVASLIDGLQPAIGQPVQVN